ncbi:MAG: tetratricopeptide repeat protein [Chlorobi bacterium]|nr:tetratricopeptide repeat protein [Chlorobiota bacterium]
MNEIVDELQRRLAEATDPAERIDLMIGIIAKTSHEAPGDARKLAAKALRIARSLGDGARVARSMNCVGICEFQMGDKRSSYKWHQRAEEVARECGSDDGMRVAAHGMGMVHGADGEHARAIECFERSVELAHIIGARSKEANGLSALGCIYLESGNYGRALEHFLRAGEILAGSDEPVIACDIAMNTGIVYAELGDREKACEHYREALDMARSAGSRALQISPLTNLGNILFEQGDSAGALEHYRHALELSAGLGDGGKDLYALMNIGFLYLDTGAHDMALQVLREALPIARELDNAATWRIVFGIGRCHAELKEYPAAFEWLGNALEGSRRFDQPETEVRVHETLSISHEALGDVAKSLEHFKLMAELKERLWGRDQQRMVARLRVREEMERAAGEREILRREKEKLEVEMEHRTRELTSMALHLVEKNQFLDGLRKEMSDVVQSLDGAARPKVKGLMRQVDGNIGGGEEWRAFEAQFEKVHNDFLKRLAARSPDLSRAELKVCALLKINLSTKEIAAMLASSDRTIGNHRYRIRKKLGLNEDVNLTTHFAAL